MENKIEDLFYISLYEIFERKNEISRRSLNENSDEDFHLIFLRRFWH